MRNVVLGVIVSVLVVFMAVSCHTDFSESMVNSQDTVGGLPQISPDVATLLQRTSVRLFDGVEESDIGLTFEGRVERLRKNLSFSLGRNVQSSDTVSLSFEDVVSIIETNISNLDIPELVTPTSEDITLINQDFPGLTEDDIIRELETIRRIYQDQMGALALNSIVALDLYEGDLKKCINKKYNGV